jgi:hypothetical protein
VSAMSQSDLQNALRGDLVLFPLDVPLGFCERRDNSSDRFPFCYAKTRFGEAGQPTDNKNTENEGGAAE